jgi:hypothetical protein
METIKAKVSGDFSSHNFTDAALHVQALKIANNLANIQLFVSLATDAAEIKTLADTFGSLLIKISGGNRQMTVEKNNARAAVEEILRNTAPKVQDICGGDEASILSSGFDVNQKPTPAGILEMPLNVIVSLGKTSGSLDITWDVIEHAYSYEVRYMPTIKTENSGFLTATSTKHKITLENLTPGITYIIQVAGVGSDPKRVWSVQVISCYVS